jgi:predicted AAA+ superfamily ATPase
MITRHLYYQIEPYINSTQAIVVTGMRRVGKTTLFKFIFDKIESSNKLFLDLEKVFNRKIFEEDDYDKIAIALGNQGLDFRQRVWLFLDEIHLIKNLPSVIKYLGDHYNIKFFLTGSASFYLKNHFSESLSGRKFIFELFPLSFTEFLEAKQVTVKIPQEHKLMGQPVFEMIDNYYQEYLMFGGFPQVVLSQSVEEKKKNLQDIFNSYFELEVKGLSGFKKVNKMRDLMLLLLARVGNKLNITDLTKEIAVARETIDEYLSFLDASYFIKLVKPFSRSLKVEIRKRPKVYVCDSGLANHLTFASGLNAPSKGSLFEQVVFQTLRARSDLEDIPFGLNYYEKKIGGEIDFVFNKKEAYEVKLNATQVDVNKVKRLAQDLKLKDAKVVSLKYSELDDVVYGFELGERREEWVKQKADDVLEKRIFKEEPEGEIQYPTDSTAKFLTQDYKSLNTSGGAA